MKSCSLPTTLLFLFAALFMSACSSRNDNAAAAQGVAERWVSSNSEQVASALGRALSKDHPIIAQVGIAMLLKQGIDWRYSPVRQGTDAWQVTVTATNRTNLSRIGIKKTVTLTGSIVLQIDTNNLRVEDCRYQDFSADMSDN